MANRNSLEEVLVSVIYFILSNLLSLQLPCFKISVCHTNEQNFRRKRRQCFAQAATRGSWSLDSKLTRAGSLIDCWLYIFWYTGSILRAFPATSARSLWVEISGWLMAIVIASFTGWLLYQGEPVGAVIGCWTKVKMTIQCWDGFSHPVWMSLWSLCAHHCIVRCSSCGETANPEEGVVEVRGKI